jgi:hypothetical protein
MKKPNLLGILISVIAYGGFGAAYYSRALLGGSWIAAQGKTFEQIVPTPLPFVFSFLSSLGVALVLDQVIQKSGATNIIGGVKFGLIFGVTLSALPLATHYGFLAIPGTIALIDGSKEVISAMLVGGILGATYKNT